jgi:hypothetical protein
MLENRHKECTPLLLACLALVLSAGAPPEDAARDRGKTCVRYSTYVAYRNYGYDHHVVLNNVCKAQARCTVSTNAAPNPVRVTVAPRSRVDLLIFRGSPARSFDANVHCEVAAHDAGGNGSSVRP